MRMGPPVVLALALLWPAGSRADEPLRPPEAPLLGEGTELPPTPPEYLSHESEAIHFHYHPSARERVRILIDLADPVLRALARELGTAPLTEVHVRVAVGPGDFARVVPPEVSPGNQVLVLSEHRTLVLSLPSAPVSSAEVAADFRRGLAYLALDVATESKALPRWFRMGFARRFSGRDELARFQALFWASMEQRLVPLADLDWYLTESSPTDSVPAAEATDFVSFLLEEERRAAFPHLLEAVRAGNSFEEALADSYQQDLSSLEEEWRRRIARHKAFLPILIAGTAIWLLLALSVALRRRFRQRAVAAVRTPKRRPAMVRVRTASAAKRKPTIELPEPEVPKVSHNGRWHTLH